jgi:transposase-like protein
MSGDFMVYRLVKAPQSPRRCASCRRSAASNVVQHKGRCADAGPGVLSAWICQECHGHTVERLKQNAVYTGANWAQREYMAAARCLVVGPSAEADQGGRADVES